VDTATILDWFERSLERDKPVSIPPDIFDALTPELAQNIAERFRSYGLIRLPAYEQEFFEWLRSADAAVWDDLWGGNDEPYVVSVAFLPTLLDRRRGFPICDLMSTDNYYFFPAMLEWTAEARDYTEAVRNRFAAGETLSPEQLLVLDISTGGAIDIWHFAYYHQIPLSEAKAAVATLVEDKVLAHLRTAELLAPFVRMLP